MNKIIWFSIVIFTSAFTSAMESNVSSEDENIVSQKEIELYQNALELFTNTYGEFHRNESKKVTGHGSIGLIIWGMCDDNVNKFLRAFKRKCEDANFSSSQIFKILNIKVQIYMQNCHLDACNIDIQNRFGFRVHDFDFDYHVYMVLENTHDYDKSVVYDFYLNDLVILNSHVKNIGTKSNGSLAASLTGGNLKIAQFEAEQFLKYKKYLRDQSEYHDISLLERGAHLGKYTFKPIN